MESILEHLGLGTLLELYIDGEIHPEVILSMSESSLVRLGVENSRGTNSNPRYLRTSGGRRGEKLDFEFRDFFIPANA